MVGALHDSSVSGEDLYDKIRASKSDDFTPPASLFNLALQREVPWYLLSPQEIAVEVEVDEFPANGAFSNFNIRYAFLTFLWTVVTMTIDYRGNRGSCDWPFEAT